MSNCSSCGSSSHDICKGVTDAESRSHRMWEQHRRDTRVPAYPSKELSPHMGGVLYALYCAHRKGTKVPRLHTKSIASLERRGFVHRGEITPQGIAFIKGALWGFGLSLYPMQSNHWLKHCEEALDASEKAELREEPLTSTKD